MPDPLISTTILATVVGLAIAGLILRTRRNLDRFKTQCPKCRYNIAHGADALCPECGIIVDPSLQVRLDLRRAWMTVVCCIAWLGVLTLVARFVIGAIVEDASAHASVDPTRFDQSVDSIRMTFIGAYAAWLVILLLGVMVILRIFRRRYPTPDDYVE